MYLQEIKEEEIIEETPTEELKETKKEELKKINQMLLLKSLQMKPLRQRKLWIQMKRQQSRKDKRVKLYLMNQNVAEDKETEGQERRRVIAKDVENETDVSVKDRKIATTDIDSIGKKVEKIIEKITEKLKELTKNYKRLHLFYQKE